MKRAFVYCMIACSLHDSRGCGELNADRRGVHWRRDVELVILNYAALYASAHCHVHVMFTVCCM